MKTIRLYAALIRYSFLTGWWTTNAETSKDPAHASLAAAYRILSDETADLLKKL